MGKRPSLQWYPGDWLRDPAVRSLSFAAKGLWTDMLCLMFENDRKGYLILNGKPVTAEQLARMTGGSTDEVSRLLSELESSGVFSRTDHGMIYSRRMVRDERLREVRSESGKKGAKYGYLGGRPKNENLPPAKKGQGKGQKKGQNNPPSSSSSSSPSEEVSNDTSSIPLPPSLDCPAFREVWKLWEQHRNEKRKPLTPTSVKQQLEKLASWGSGRAVAAIKHSIANGWQGIFEPDAQGPAKPGSDGFFDGLKRFVAEGEEGEDCDPS